MADASSFGRHGGCCNNVDDVQGKQCEKHEQELSISRRDLSNARSRQKSGARAPANIGKLELGDFSIFRARDWAVHARSIDRAGLIISNLLNSNELLYFTLIQVKQACLFIQQE